MFTNRKNTLTSLAILIPLLCLFSVVVYNLPPVNERLAWRVDELQLRAGYAMNPPEKQVFVPSGANTPLVTVVGGAPVESATPEPTASPPPLPSATAAGPADTPLPSPTATLAATPLPPQMVLSGVRYEDQHGRWNYCAPANLSMALTYWGWQGNRDVVGPVLKPLEKDKNVMPYEMVDYVNQNTGVRAMERVGGDHEVLKRLIAAGFPVVVETGTYLRDISGVVSWMGHYLVVNGYDDAAGFFLVQDSYVEADHEIPYDKFTSDWRAFNYTYVIVYPAEREAEVLALLGSNADEKANAENAAQKASDEIYSLSGIDQYFAWFNRGSSLVRLQDYAGAAQAYDEAFKVYPAIPEAERPWRMMWYQTGPYFAYFYSQRYGDVLSLADSTLDAMQSDKNLEESYYWRGMARAKLGDTAAAIEDYNLALEYHPGFGPAAVQLQQLAAQTP